MTKNEALIRLFDAEMRQEPIQARISTKYKYTEICVLRKNKCPATIMRWHDDDAIYGGLGINNRLITSGKAIALVNEHWDNRLKGADWSKK